MNRRSVSELGLLTDLHFDGGPAATVRLISAIERLKRRGAGALVVLGDLVNGEDRDSSIRLLRQVKQACDRLEVPVYYLPGNHDLDYLSKEEFYAALGQNGAPIRFVLGGCTFLYVDGNYSPDDSEYERGNFEWQQSFVSAEHLSELRTQLTKCSGPVVVVSHQRVDHECIHAVRNHETVRACLADTGNVRAVFQGHNHESDRREIDGIMYHALAAHVDGAPPMIARLNDDSIVLESLGS